MLNIDVKQDDIPHLNEKFYIDDEDEVPELKTVVHVYEQLG